MVDMIATEYEAKCSALVVVVQIAATMKDGNRSALHGESHNNHSPVEVINILLTGKP